MKHIRIAAIALIAAAALLPGAASAAPYTERISVDSAELEATGGDSVDAAVSANGRFVAFSSAAVDLVAGDSNGKSDVFVRDRANGTTERVSLDSSEVQGLDDSTLPAISGDGRFVTFHSKATNLVASDTNAGGDIFLRDRTNGTTERISVDSSETQSNNNSGISSITSDGRYVAFESIASNLVPGDAGGWDIFVRDLQLGTTEKASFTDSEGQADGNNWEPSISDDGNMVAFYSSANNLTPADQTIHSDVFLRDRTAGTTTLLSVSSAEVQSDYPSNSTSISADGLKVAFISGGTNLVPNDPSGYDAFVRDVAAGTTERVSVSSDETGANSSSANPSISGNGRFVAFDTYSTNLVPNDTTSTSDVFVRDLLLGTTERVSVTTAGAGSALGNSFDPSINADGGVVAFQSVAVDLVSDDTNLKSDVFVHAYDIDLDGISDYSDNCPTVANTDGQAVDQDGDIAGDACDAPGTGNVDCNQVINSIDALKVLRFSASLSVAQSEPCTDIGEPIGSTFDQGNVDCSAGNPNSIDALKILRAVALLTVSQQPGCGPVIGP